MFTILLLLYIQVFFRVGTIADLDEKGVRMAAYMRDSIERLIMALGGLTLWFHTFYELGIDIFTTDVEQIEFLVVLAI